MIRKTLFGIFLYQSTSFGVVVERPIIPWTLNQTELRYSLNSVAIDTNLEVITPTWDQILMRIYLNQTDQTVEKVGLYFSENNLKNVGPRILKIALKGSEAKLMQKMVEKLVLDPETKRYTAEISKDVLPFVDSKKVLGYFATRHYQLTIPPPKSEASATALNNLIQQTDGYLSIKKRISLKQMIKDGKSLHVDQDLLPEFARKNVGQFNIVKGPNCFHSALSFQGEKFSRLPFVNAKREEGYDSAMINHDELWTALQNAFYEVNPGRSELKYGDIIVFSELDKNREDTPFDFRRIKHASTYLFDGYMFSKGSKSANSPYIIKPLTEEWTHWERDSTLLGVKVFRRAFKNVRDIPLVVQELF